jgi:hypothetical protein
MFVLPADEAAVPVYIFSVVLHILIPSLMVIAFLLYINHEVTHKVTPDKLLIWVRSGGLVMSALFSFGFLAFYVPVSENTCRISVSIFQALPVISKFFVHLFYALRYRNLATELNLSKWTVNIFLPLTTCNMFIGWIPYWLEMTAIDENGLCIGFFDESSLALIAVFMVLDIALGSFMLYMFAKPFLSHEKSLRKTSTAEFKNIPNADKKTGTNEKKQTALKTVLRKAFFSSAVSLMSTVVTTVMLAFAFYWNPTLSILFASDITSLLDSSINCLILLYSYKDFKAIFWGVCGNVFSGSQAEPVQGTMVSSVKGTSNPPSPSVEHKGMFSSDVGVEIPK